MQTTDNIRARIQAEALRGDWIVVAEKLGKSVSLVHKVVAGTRQNDDVIKEFIKLLDIRVEVMGKYQTA